MLKLIQKVISFKPSDFTTNDEWSDNLLPAHTVAYELTIGGDAGNKFVLDESKEPFIIQAAENGSAIPLAIYRHKAPIKSLHVHRDNTYNMSTIINILISVDEKNLDQWLDEVNSLSGELEDLTKKVELMYGTAFGIEDYNLGDRLLFLEKTINPEEWNSTNYKLPMASAIGGWGDAFEEEQIGNNTIWDITTAIRQGLIYDDTYLTEEV